MSNLDLIQKQAIVDGAKKRKRLIKVVKRAVQRKGGQPTYIYSPPGLGKTYSVTKALNSLPILHHLVSGNVSIFAFGVRLAALAYPLHKAGITDTIVINVDDCDELLKNEANINVLKNMLEGVKQYAYEKSIVSQKPSLTTLQLEAVSYFSSPESLGFVVPLDNFNFIFTSNYQLPNDDDVLEAQKRGGAKAVLMGHKNAIRSRCQTNDFRLTKNEQWGWIADVVLNDNAIDFLNEKQQHELLNWMYSNWENMTERSIRTANKMADAMIEDPTDYIDDWEIDFLKC